MKADIHPNYHEITVVMTDGTSYKTRSSWGKEGDTLNLDVDPLNHPAWQGGSGQVVEKGQLDKFESRYGSFLSGGAGQEQKKQAAPAPEKAEEEKADPEQAAEEKAE